MKYRIKHIRCKNLMLLEAANLNMPSSFIIKTKKPMSKYDLKRMAAKIIRESYGQRMSNCIVEALDVENLDVDSARAGIGLRTRLKYEFINVQDLVYNFCIGAEEISQYAKKIGATQVYKVLDRHINNLYAALENATDTVADAYGRRFYESYSQPKYRRLVEELETDGPRGSVSPSRYLKGRMKDYISRSYGGHQRLSARIQQLDREGDKLLDALQHLRKVAEKLGNKNIYDAIDDLIYVMIGWGEVLQTCGDLHLTTNYSTPEQRYMKDRWNRYNLYNDDI